MDRNREAKKMNGIKRRYRSGSLSLRESPVHDDAVDMHENSRFRDRKKERDSDRDRDRERNRLSQSKRYKRKDDDESSEESVDEEEEDDDEIEAGELRSTPFARDSSVKHVRSLPPWVGDEVGGISVPRKARTASGKRSHDCWISGGEASTSPPRPSTKKMKNTIKSKPSSKISKASSSSIQEIEFEVAEVLYGMTRRASNTSTLKPEGEDSKPTASSSISAQSVSQTSSALEQSSSLKSSPASSVVPKRKKSRLVKSEDGSSLTLSTSYASKMVLKIEGRVSLKTESSSPKVEKFEESNLETSGINAPISDPGQIPMEMEKCSMSELELPVHDCLSELGKEVERQSGTEITKENVCLPSESSKSLVDADQADISAMKWLNPTEDNESLATTKIDLMAPPVKSSPDSTLETVSNFMDHIENKLQPPDFEKKTGSNEERRHEDDKQEVRHFNLEEGKADNGSIELEPHADKESQDKDDSKCSKQKLIKPMKHETKVEKFGECSSLSMHSWPGNGLPPIGFIGQVPSLQAVIPMGPNIGSSPIVETRIFRLNQQPKRCAMHCYIAKSIQSNERAKTNPFWPGSVSAASICGAVNTYNLNAIPIAECATVCNPVQGNIGGKNSDSSQEKASSGNSLKDKGPSAIVSEASQRKPLVLQHVPQANNTQQQLITTARSVIPAKSTSSNSNVVPSSGASNYIAGGSISTGSVNTGAIVTSGVGFPYPTVSPNEGQYLAIVQNNGYPIQVPAHVRMPSYVSGHAQPAFFGGSFYPSQVLHPSQIQQSQSQTPTSQSSGSSSQKNQQHLLQTGFSNNSGAVSHNHLTSKQRQQPNPSMNPHQSGEENPSTTDTRVSHSQKNIYSQNFPLPVPQNFVLVSSSSLPSGANHNEKQQKASKGGVELVPAQAYAMSFASLNGAPPAPALDFSSVAPNHVVFHAISDHVRPGYQIAVASSNASASQSKHQHQGIEEAKTVNEPIKTNQISAEGKKVLPEGPTAIEHNIAFSKTDGHVSSIDGSARSLNSVQSSLNNNRTRSVPTVSSTTNIAPRMNAPMANLNSYNNMAKLPASHSVFQQSLLEGSNGGHTQWRTSARTIPTTVGSSSALPGKNMPSQVKNQHNLSTSGHTQISFSTSPKVTPQVHGGSPSPRPSTSKSSPATTLPLQSAKNSPSNSSTKLSSINPNPSILGNPPVSGAKTTIQHNLQQKQQFQQTQFFFNAYPIVQSAQPSSVSMSHQRRQLDQSTSNPSTSSNGVFSLCPPSFSTSDPTKVLPAQVSAMKGMLPSPSILHATHSAHSVRPYMHTVQTKPNKPTSDAKPATGV